MNAKKYYVARIVVKNQDIWFDAKDFEKVYKKKEYYYIDEFLFFAKNKDEAFELATDFVDICDDVNHDGPGDLFVAKGLGIHDIFELSFIDEGSIDRYISENGWVNLGSLKIDDIIHNDIPRVITRD